MKLRLSMGGLLARFHLIFGRHGRLEVSNGDFPSLLRHGKTRSWPTPGCGRKSGLTILEISDGRIRASNTDAVFHP